MADLGYVIDYKIKNTIDNKLNPYLKMIRDKMRDIDNKSTSSVLEVKKLLDEFLGEYNQFRAEVSSYVESMNEITEQLSNATSTINTMGEEIKSLQEELLKSQTDLTGLTNKYNSHLTKKYYAVSHYLYGGSNVKNYSILEGQSISAPSSTKDNYNLEGWYYDEEFSNKVEFPLVINDNVDLHANWKEIVYYTITFITPYGSVEPISVMAGEKVSLPTLTEDGYYFKGWYYDETFENKATSSITVNSDITLYAKWEAIVYYTVSFISGYDYTVDPITVEEGTSIQLPAITRENYAFDGWFDSDGNQITSPYTVVEDITLTAQWTSLVDATFISDLNIRYIKFYSTIYSSADANLSINGITAMSNGADAMVGAKYTTNRMTTWQDFSGSTTATGSCGFITFDLLTGHNIENIFAYFSSNQKLVLVVSEDGINWYVIAKDFTASKSSTNGNTFDLTTKVIENTELDNTYKSGRYVKLTLYKNENSLATRYSEIRIFNMLGEMVSYAKPVYYSWDSTWNENTALNDNNNSTYITGKSASTEQYIIIDLGQIEKIKWAKIYSAQNGGYNILKVDVSDDNNTYTNITNTSGSDSLIKSAIRDGFTIYY